MSENNLYRKVKKRGTLTYLKCYYDHCDGSAKIEHEKLCLEVHNDYAFCDKTNLLTGRICLFRKAKLQHVVLN